MKSKNLIYSHLVETLVRKNNDKKEKIMIKNNDKKEKKEKKEKTHLINEFAILSN